MASPSRVILCLLALFCAAPVFAALGSEVSEALTGQLVPEVQAETLDGKIFTLSDLNGSPVLVNFFASWCPTCQAEDKEPRAIYAAYAPRGLRFVGVLVDSVETPDTMEAAREQLRLHPLPYPVVLMDKTMGASFRYTGFPATYFVTPDGLFSTTLYGYQPQDQIAMVVDRVLGSAGSQTTSASLSAPVEKEAGSRPAWDRVPLRALIPRWWKQWHPAVIHFPIAFLILEAAFVVAYVVKPSGSLERFSRWLLWCAVASFVPAILTGLNDVGTDLGPGWAFWNGLVDRVRHLFLLKSTVSLHVLFALATVTVTVARIGWRVRAREKALQGRSRLVFLTLTLLGVWMLFAAGQVGGSISHR
jgi:thiol-disulfide isomerase/thioredoxin/uncharacterized membrane protein